MDGLFIFIGLIIFLIFNRIKKGTIKKFKDILIISFSSLITVSPWILWNIIKLQRLLPVSGEALKLMRKQSAAYICLVIESMFTSSTFISNFFIKMNSLVVSIIVFSLFVILSIFVLIKLKKDKLLKEILRKTKFLIFGIILYHIYYWFFALWLRPWYSIFDRRNCHQPRLYSKY